MPEPPRRLRAFATEMFAVVGGILIAFSLDAWWDGRQMIEWEELQLRALHEEFSNNLVEFETVQQDHDQAVEHVFGMLEQVSEVPAGTLVTFSDSALYSLVGWRTSDVHSGTLDALLASGQLTRIRDPETRRLLAEWPAELENGLEDEQLARDFVVHSMAPGLAGEGLMFHAYTTHMERTWPRMEEVPRNVTVRTSVAMQDLLAERLRHLRYNAMSSVQLQTVIGTILDAIEGQFRDFPGSIP
jgi:hypothetical protein